MCCHGDITKEYDYDNNFTGSEYKNTHNGYGCYFIYSTNYKQSVRFINTPSLIDYTGFISNIEYLSEEEKKHCYFYIWDIPEGRLEQLYPASLNEVESVFTKLKLISSKD